MKSLLSVKLTGKKEAVDRLRRFGPQVMAVLIEKTTSQTLILQRHVVEDKLSGQVLNVRTGNLRRSISEKVNVQEWRVTGRVYSSGDVKYAAIHEFGGTIVRYPFSSSLRLRTDRKGNLMRQSAIQAMEGRSVRAQAALQNAAVFAKSSHKSAVTRRYTVGQYTIKMPERSFLRSSLADRRAAIVKDLKSAVLAAGRAS